MAGEGEKVKLNVYDLSQGLARQLSSTFLGKAIEAIWHTGIVVYGHEYYFGGGIQSCPEGKAPYGKPMKIIELGWTQVPKEMFEEYLQEISPRYTAATYSLLKHNCNNFSDEISQFLVGAGIPQYILQLPQDVMGSPMGALIMPMIQQFETILRYGGVPQAPHMAMPQSIPNFSQIQLPSLPFSAEHSSIPNSIASQKPSFGQMAAITVPPAVAPSNRFDSEVLSTTGSIEPRVKEASETKEALGEARSRVQQEITREFTVLMAKGTLRASEAAALATRRVMERYNRGPDVAPQS